MHKLRFGVLAVATTLVLAACGGSDGNDDTMTAGSAAKASPTATATQAAFNDADVVFAQMMIPHHTQAITMAKLAATRAQSAEVKQVAQRIEAAQQPEIDTMTGWLKGWGTEVPAVESSSMPGHDMSSNTGTGMMTEEEMASLEAASGAKFDRMFLEMMIKHHAGAIAMAKDEISSGRNTEAIALAQKVAGDQTKEITQMRALLAD